MKSLLHFLLCQSCRSLRNVSSGELHTLFLRLIKMFYPGWLSLMTSSKGPFFTLVSGPPILSPQLRMISTNFLSWLCLLALLRQFFRIRDSSWSSGSAETLLLTEGQAAHNALVIIHITVVQCGLYISWSWQSTSYFYFGVLLGMWRRRCICCKMRVKERNEIKAKNCWNKIVHHCVVYWNHLIAAKT